jgi:hypothetical protein
MDVRKAGTTLRLGRMRITAMLMHLSVGAEAKQVRVSDASESKTFITSMMLRIAFVD